MPINLVTVQTNTIPLEGIGVDLDVGQREEITLAAGTFFPRFSVIADDGTGKGRLLAATTDRILGVLVNPVDTSATGYNAVAPGVVWRRGGFVKDAFVFGGSPALSYDTPAVRDALRAVGIYAEGSIPALDNFS